MKTRQKARGRLRALLIAFGLAIAGLVVAVVPAQAWTGDNYPEPWRSAPVSAYVDSWGYYSRQCTSWVAWALHDRNGFEIPRAIGNADQWGYWASSAGYTVNMTPSVGSVAWWNSMHVAWVEAVNGDQVTIEEYNFASSGRYNRRVISRTSVSGYIHFKDITTSPPAPPPTPSDWYYLNNNFDGAHDILTQYGNRGEEVLVGDWDGNGTDTLGIRRGGTYYLNNNFDGMHDIVTSYGDSSQQVLVGDWDGDGDDTLGVRVGGTYYLNNNFDAWHDIEVHYGDGSHQVLVGDWNGDGVDTLGVRSGGDYYLNNNFDAWHDILTSYGNGSHQVLAGDWDGNGTDTLGVRDGFSYYLNNNFDAWHDIATAYGDSAGHVLVGDWDGNGVDTLGFRPVN